MAALTGRARAVDTTQFWPELNLFDNLGPPTRLFLDATYVRDREADGRSLELAGYLDVTLEPFLRRSLRKEDWQKNKYLWLRLGYDHLFKTEGGEKQTGEDRVILSAYPRTYLPEEDVLEGPAAGGPPLDRRRLLHAVLAAARGEPRVHGPRLCLHAVPPGRGVLRHATTGGRATTSSWAPSSR